ncbi:MAG: glycosyltransferase family 39 protein [Flavobacteriaceae bacterium]|nr:glycosyltransferase family 39 protein [Flavobacteriaceae bacterium]
MPKEKYKNTSFYLFISVIVFVLFRFILTGAIPLLDKTEARYAEIARLMYETKDWVVLQIDYGIPFWAKPPLSTWLSAISFEIFGVNEIAARFPSFLMAIGILIIVGIKVKKSKLSFYLPGFILLTMPEFLIHTGVVSTDSALGFSVVLIMLSFWEAINSDKRLFWNYLFFIAIGLGLLAKGPIVLILTIPPIFIWCLLKKGRFKEVFLKLPWVLGFFIICLVAIPWYVLAEQQSPGFIDYFIVGEHIKRFIEPGWHGDLYGGPKSQALGMIWIFLLIFTFPWIQVILYMLWKGRQTIFKNKWVSYLVLWLFWTPLFFTLSKNILHTYIIPVTVPIALLMVYWWKGYQKKILLLSISSIFPVFAIIVFFGFFLNGTLDTYANSDKYLLYDQNIHTTEKEVPIYYWKQKSYSGQFYSAGRAKVIQTPKALDSVMKQHDKLFFVVLNKNKDEISGVFKERLTFLESNYKTSIFVYEYFP